MNNNHLNKHKPRLSEDKLTVDYDIEDFSENLPNLAKELTAENHDGRIPVEELRFEDKIPEDPGVEDFIRRCSQPSEAEKIIDFMEMQGEITFEEANNCREKLKNGGLQIFGPHKEFGYYEKEFRQNRKYIQF